MTAYYNEFDPYAAQWLRNLIAAGHIAPGDVDERSIEAMTNQVLLEGNASYPVIDDMSGKAPKPSKATPYSQQTCVAQAARSQDDAQSQSHATLRTTRSTVARLDLDDRSACSANLEASFLLSSLCISPPLTGGAREILVQISRYLRVYIRLSTAICCVALGRLRNALRNVGNCGRPQSFRRRSISCMQPCTFLNSISYASERAASLRRTARSVVSTFSTPLFNHE